MILRFKDSDDIEKVVEIGPNRRVEIEDEGGSRYEIRPDKFGGIEVLASDGALAIEPKVSNQIILKTIV